jgi:hypothetical protein
MASDETKPTKKKDKKKEEPEVDDMARLRLEWGIHSNWSLQLEHIWFARALATGLRIEVSVHC